VVAVAVAEVAMTVEVDEPRLAVTSDVSCVLAAFATSWSTVANGVPLVGRSGSVPSTEERLLANVLPGSTGSGRSLADGLTPALLTCPVAVAVGSPAVFLDAEAELQPDPRLKAVAKGAGKGFESWLQVRGSCWD
jgi:hypothetical protein